MNKPSKNGIFKSHLEHFADKNLPKDNKCYQDKSGNKIELTNLRANKTIFYFATTERDFTKSIKPQVEAYDNLKNSGVVRVNKDGDATVYLKCPQLYINTDGNVYSRHMHFLYWDDSKSEWNKNLYTQQILCNVYKNFLNKYMNKAKIVDTRPEKYYNISHFKNAINIPYNKRWTEATILEKLNCKDKLIPIILYCSKDSDMGHKLFDKLNKLGFYNTLHVEGNIV
jgi:hypothetical protein